MQADNSRYAVKSVANAVRLLQILERDAGQEGLNLTTVAKRLTMSKSATLSLLETLSAFGLVEQSTPGGTSRMYRLGLALIRMGHSAAKQTTVADVCYPELRDLASATHLTARAAVLDSDGWAVAVARVDSPDTVRLDLRLGEREWPHRSGVGKALMSLLPKDLVLSYLKRLGMPSNTERTITTAEDFLADLELSRKRGFFMDDEEDADGIVCIAVPVRNPDDSVFAAISVTGLKIGPLRDSPELVAHEVAEHARTLEARLAPVPT